MDEALIGWLGPLSAHQDFWYESTGLHEAKSVGPTMSAVKISSEYQLDALGEALELVVLSLADAVEDSSGAVNLVGLVAQVRAALEALSANDDELQIRLAHMGVDIDHRYYADNWFLVTSLSNYAVTDDFPAVRASELPPGVVRVNYRIELGAIEPFKTSTQQIA